MARKRYLKIACAGGYAVFVLLSLVLDYEPGRQIGANLAAFSGQMLQVLPCAFVLIGLFEVWVSRNTVIRHLGEDAGLRAYVWAVVLASTTVGGVLVALPVAHSLHGKGAKLSVVLAYVGASALCRAPMVVFEASFMGLKFTLIRLIVGVPLVIVTSIFMGRILSKRGYRLAGGE
jgi:uncharacterized membrane protein YraQ (UPF0718 family)